MLLEIDAVAADLLPDAYHLQDAKYDTSTPADSSTTVLILSNMSRIFRSHVPLLVTGNKIIYIWHFSGLP